MMTNPTTSVRVCGICDIADCEAHRHAPNVGAVKVKPLVWTAVEVDRGDGSRYATGGNQAESLFGLYVIDLGWGSDCYYWSTESPEGDDLGSNFEDLDRAKAAAQADYAARILSAIETTPDPRDELIARLVDAAYAIEMWDAARGYPIPYRHRDPLRAALASAKEVMK